MAFPVTINGRTYTLADFEGTNYVDGFPDALEDFVTQAGDIYNSTSISDVAIGTGSKTFIVADTGKPYQAGTPLRIADAAAPETNFMDCIVTSYTGTTLVVDAFGYAGSGTKSSWTVNIGGAKTVDGTLAIAQGGTGATTAAAAATALGLGTGDSPEFAGLTVDGEDNKIFVQTSTAGVGGYLFVSDSIVTNATHLVSDNDLYINSDNNDNTNGEVYITSGSAYTKRALFDNTGNISFYDDTGVSQSFYWDASTERLGLGTTSPATALDVNGTVAADGVTSSGVVRIESSTPDIRLLESDEVDLNGRLVNASGELFIQTMNDAQSTAKSRIKVDHDTGDISFYEDNGLVQKFFWDASAESLGIGTTSPARDLHVNDVMRLEPRATAPSSPSAGDIFFNSTTNKLQCYDGTAWQNCF